MARLLAVNVGVPRAVAWRGETVHTAVWKTAVEGPRTVRRLNVDGDAQADLAGHGGEQRAVMVYQMDSYRYWERELGRNDFVFGQFGENFTVEGLPDNEICIGDRYRIGGALFEVSQPRVTCYRVGIRMNEPAMPSLLVSHHRPGFYFRVLEEGEVKAGDEITKVTEGPEHMTVAEIDALLYLPGRDKRQLERSLNIPALSPGWRGSFRSLLDQECAAAPISWTGFRPLLVSRIQRESREITSFTFQSPDRSPLPPALPGQFLVLKLPASGTGQPVIRNYSLSGPPGADTYRISVKREPSGVASRFLHDHLNVGQTLEVSAPRGSFTLRAGEGPVVLASAGVGITPVLAMLHALVAEHSTREVWWLHGARDREAHAFIDEAYQLLQALPHSNSHIVYSRPGPDDRLGCDYQSPGRLNVSLFRKLNVPCEADFYLCGPSAFLTAFRDDLKAWGVSATRIHLELFGPETRKNVVPHPPPGPAGTGPQVTFTRSGLTVRWRPDFRSLLELAEACDVPAHWSCRTGVCHVCECGLLEGNVDYDPQPLDAPAPGAALICCTKPRGELQLDL